MAGLSGRAKRLERDASYALKSFELLDGTKHYFVPGGEVYMHCWHCLQAGTPDRWPEPPEIIHKVLEAQDLGAALQSIWSQGIANIFPYDKDALIRERRLVPCALVEGKDPYERTIDDLSEASHESH
jgi:hypothetical protein